MVLALIMSFNLFSCQLFHFYLPIKVSYLRILLQDLTKYKEPTSLFEHFIVVGLHPDANLEVVEDAFAKRKKWELQMANSEILEFKMLQHRAPSIPTLEPQVDCMTKFFPGTILCFFYFQQYMI